MNSSMIYVGCPGSSTVLHIEPGQLCSINTLLRGRKAWRIIPEYAMERFMTLYRRFGLSTSDSHTCTQGNFCSVCDCPNVGTHAPVFFASSEFWNAHGIEHYDTTYLNPGVGHAIINLDFCVAEALTLLPLIIGGNRDETHCCRCNSEDFPILVYLSRS